MIRFSLLLLLVFVAVQCRKAVIALRGQTVGVGCQTGFMGFARTFVQVEVPLLQSVLNSTTIRENFTRNVFPKSRDQSVGLTPLNLFISGDFELSATKEARYGIRPYLRITHNCAGFVDRLCLDLGEYTHDMDFTLGQFPLQNGLNVMPEEEYNKDLYRC